MSRIRLFGRPAVLLITALTILTATGTGQKPGGSEKSGLNWTSLEEAIERAGNEKKPVLLDVYTDWCGWCKKLDKETFNDPKVAEVLSNMFTLAKVNGESREEIIYKDQKTNGIGLARGFGIRGYPAIIFLDEKGDMLTLIPGFLDAEQFLPVVKFIGTREYENTDWEVYLKNYESSKKGGKTK